MLFVYHFEENPQFGAAASQVLETAESGRCRLVTSVLSLLEVLVVPKRRGLQELVQRYKDFFHAFPHLDVVDIGPEIAEIASELRASTSLRTPDALHLATALHYRVQAFLSEDTRLRAVPGLRILPLAQVHAELSP